MPWRTIVRVCLAALLVWCALRLTWLLLLVLIAALLAVTLDPVVRRLTARRLPRWGASALVIAVLMGGLIGFGVLASSQLASQAELVSTRIVETAQHLLQRLPAPWASAFTQSPEHSFDSGLASFGLAAVQAASNALLLFVLAAILTLYFLIEGRATCAWLVAFFPEHLRPKIMRTMEECQTVIFSYVAGNIATSMFAGGVVFIALRLLHVPAALLLGLLAALCDFVPVLGFAVSSIPAILLALTVSPGTAFSVALLYIGYHTLENYLIAPYVYGDALRLSNVVIVLAFAAGAELGGVVGAVVALPIAAAYPAVERIWLRDALGAKVVKEHETIERKGAAAADD